MTILKVIQVPDRGFTPGKEGITGSRVFEVYTDDALTDEAVILAAVDPVTFLSIPVTNDAWSGSFPTCKVQGYDYGELDEGFGRSVTVNYSEDDEEEEDPTDDEWQITITEQDRQADLTRDQIQNKNVENTAGDPTPVGITESDVSITISRNISPGTWGDKDIHKYKKSMNKNAVQINGTQYAARQLLMWNINTNTTIQTRNGIQFLSQTLVILSKPDAPANDQNGNALNPYGWTVVLLNAGLREKDDDGELIPISDGAGNETTTAWPLDAQGVAIRSNGISPITYIYNSFFLYPEENWGGLNLI